MLHWTMTGLRHRAAGEENQDVTLDAENDAYQVMALADGVSSSPRSREGAQIACQTAVDALMRNGGLFMTCEPGKTAAYLTAQVQEALRRCAGQQDVGDLASTLVCCLRQKADGRTLLLGLGDSLALTIRGGEARIALYPCDERNGIVSTADEDAARSARVACLDGAAYDNLLLCSDGAWQHWLDGDQVKPDVARMLSAGDHRALTDWMAAQPLDDDSSFILLK